MVALEEQKFNSYSHLLGAFAGIAGSIILIYASLPYEFFLTIVAAISGLSVTFLFFASTMYHATKVSDDEDNFWRKLDHGAIFIMIAGCFTTPMYIYTSGVLFGGVLLSVWIFSIIGIFFKISNLNTPKWVNFVVYSSIVLISVIPITVTWETTQSIPGTVIPMNAIKGFLIWGMGLYGIGGIFYLLKNPKFIPPKVGSHGVFHVFVLLGAFMHFLALYFTIKSYPAIQLWAVKKL